MIREIEHLGMTVSNITEVTNSFREAFGALIELITYSDGIDYPAESEAKGGLLKIKFTKSPGEN